MLPEPPVFVTFCSYQDDRQHKVVDISNVYFTFPGEGQTYVYRYCLRVSQQRTVSISTASTWEKRGHCEQPVSFTVTAKKYMVAVALSYRNNLSKLSRHGKTSDGRQPYAAHQAENHLVLEVNHGRSRQLKT